MALMQENVFLADKTWFKTGGAARYFCEPQTVAEVQEALVFAKQRTLPIFFLGAGANLLVNDAGVNGVVIRLANKKIELKGNGLVCAGGGVMIDDLITFCLEHNLKGLEELSGIPGTVGGSVFINIHYFNFMLSDFLVSARVIDLATGALFEVPASWFCFGYDYSTLHERKHALFDATFKLMPCSELEAAYAKGRSVEIIRHRRQRYPYQGTCGSFFRNFREDEVTITSNGKKMIFVAYYLDKLGVKGELAVGGAIVSHQHANMIVNKGGATSADIIALARTMQQMVRDRFGIIPHPECQLLGFDTTPFLG